MEKQKTQNSPYKTEEEQSTGEEEQSWRTQTTLFQDLLQGYPNNNSLVLAKK